MTATYANYFSKKYPIPLTGHISLDAKLKFIREHIEPDEIDTLIIGSSLALNNIQGVYLEKSSIKCNKVLNLSAYGVSTLQAEQLMQLSDAFPNLERIIYSTQYSDFPHGKKVFLDYKPKLLMNYMTNKLNPVEYQLLTLKSCKDISFCIKRQEKWEEEHGKNNKFSYLGFDATGSAPLNIYGKDIIMHRWNNPHPGIMSPESFRALDRMSKKAKESGINFYLVQQPYRGELAKRKKIKDALDYFASKCTEILSKNSGIFLSLHETLHLSDEYFADRTHLNDKGSIIAAEAIGNFIDKHEK